MKNDIIAQDPQTFAVLGAAMTVSNYLGNGFLEAVYQEALQRELEALEIPFKREAILRISYKGQLLDTGYKVDFICFGTLLVELKALKRLSDLEFSQVLNYLKAANLQKALLLNFGNPRLEYRRIVL